MPMQDMTPPSADRSIRNIPVSNKPQAEGRSLPPAHYPGPRHSRRVWWWIAGVALACAAASVLLSTVFAGASVVLYPKTQTITPPATIVAQPNAPTGMLSYQTMNVKQSASTTVAASGVQRVSKLASGVITIFNAYSTASQPLVAKTRFAAPDGKIYRIQTALVVTGAVKKADGTLTPGSTTATVYADAPGAAYNRAEPTRFTLPGFAGKPQYATIYAQSLGALGGGFVGEQPMVAPAEMAKAQQLLHNQLEAAVASAAQTNLPSGFASVAHSLDVVYGDITQTPGTGSAVVLSQTAQGIEAIVRGSDLAVALATQVASGYRGEAIDFADLSQITLSVSGDTKPVGALTIGLSGTSTLVWQFDADAVKQALLGKKKSEFETIIKTFQPAVERAALTVRPFWEPTLPADPNRLSVTASQ